MPLDALSQSLAEALGFDEAVVSLVHATTGGAVSAFDNQYIDPESGRWRSTDAMSFVVPSATIEEYDALVDRLRDTLLDRGYLPFLTTDHAFEDRGPSPTLVLLKSVDKIEIPIVLRTVQSALHLGIDDTQMLATLREWDRRLGIEFEADAGARVRLKFDRLPRSLREFRAQALALCPGLASAVGSDTDPDTLFAAFEVGRKLTLSWR